jgi:hypothetical protein
LDRCAIQVYCFADQVQEFETIDALDAHAVGQGKGGGQPLAPLADAQGGNGGGIVRRGGNAQLTTLDATDQGTGGARRPVQIAFEPAIGSQAQRLDLSLCLNLSLALGGGVESRGTKAANKVWHTQAGKHAAIHRVGRKVTRNAKGKAA